MTPAWGDDEAHGAPVALAHEVVIPEAERWQRVFRFELFARFRATRPPTVDFYRLVMLDDPHRVVVGQSEWRLGNGSHRRQCRGHDLGRSRPPPPGNVVVSGLDTPRVGVGRAGRLRHDCESRSSIRVSYPKWADHAAGTTVAAAMSFLPCAPAIDIDGARVLVGAASWTERSLVRDADWYPKKTMKAATRMAFYSSRFPIVEVETTYYFPPTPEVCRQWAERTPEGFTMDVRGWSLLTGQPTIPPSLWPDLHNQVQPERRDQSNLYAAHLPTSAIEECWARFAHALRPLHEAGRLGAVVLAYPHWLSPKAETRAEVAAARERLPDYRLAVEFGNEKWLGHDEIDTTLGWLEDHNIALACADAAELPLVVAATSPLAVVRLHGRRPDGWDPRPHRPTHRFPHQYTRAELRDWVPRIRMLTSSVEEVHVILNNCYGDYAVRNAEQLIDALTVRPACRE